jgi:hypothetical protein
MWTRVTRSLPRRSARRSIPAVLAALVLAMTACLPATQAPVRSLPPLARSSSAPVGDGQVRSLLSLPPVPFEAVPGSSGEPATYRARAGGLTAFYGPGGVGYAIVGHDPAEVDAETVARCQPSADRAPGQMASTCTTMPPSSRWWLHQDFVGARMTAPVALEPAETVASYLVGPASAWQTGLPTYHRLAYHDAWPGIDVVYERDGALGLKATYHLAPGASADAIRLLWRGADARIGEDGSLVLATPLGDVHESAPLAWQEADGQRRPVEARFAIVSQLAGDAATAETEVGFELGVHDPGRPLVIDPTLLYASFFGGGGRDIAAAMVMDGSQAIYIAGATGSTQSTFPNGNGLAPLGAPGFDKTYNGGTFDAFVLKLNAGGATVAYVTYLGGTGDEYFSGLAVDASGAVYGAGQTNSTQATFPSGNGLGTLGVPGFDQSYNGGVNDAFVAKLAPSGTSLSYITYIGGSGNDQGPGISIDGSGAAYVFANTDSTEATLPNGAGLAGLGVPGFDQTFNGGQFDVFVVRLAPDGRSLGYATYLGGDTFEVANGIVAGSGGAAYIVGYTASTEATFPNGTGLAGLGVPGFDQTYNGGNTDVYVVRLTPDGRHLGFATFIGGDGDDTGTRIVLDSSEAIYVVGVTSSTEASFPDGDPNNNDQIDVPGFDQTYNGSDDAFVVKLGPGGTTLAFATYLGGGDLDTGTAIALGPDQAVYVAGFTGSTQSTFPNGAGFGSLALPGFDQTFNGGQYDTFLLKLAPSGTSVLYGTYVGGNGGELTYGLLVDPNGMAYVVGSTTSTEATFPDGDSNGNDQIDVPGFDRGQNGDEDAYIVKVGPAPTSTPTPAPTSTPPPTVAPTAAPGASRCAPRPNVQVVTARTGDGRLRATLRAQTLPATPTNALSALRVKGLGNARVSLAGAQVAQGQAVPLAAGTQEIVLLVERVTPGQAATVQVAVTDGCGEWSTLVGGGPGAF